MLYGKHAIPLMVTLNHFATQEEYMPYRLVATMRITKVVLFGILAVCIIVSASLLIAA